MTLALAMWLIASTPSYAVQRELTMCIEYRRDFDDAAAGDFWTDDTNAKGLGLQITITDDLQSHLRNVSDDTGCTTLDVEVSGSGVLLTVRSRSEVEGIAIESYEDSEFWLDRDVASASWLVYVPTDGHTATRALPLEQVWESLAVAGWMMNRNDFRLGTGTSRACCLESNTGHAKGTAPARPGAMGPSLRPFVFTSMKTTAVVAVRSTMPTETLIQRWRSIHVARSSCWPMSSATCSSACVPAARSPVSIHPVRLLMDAWRTSMMRPGLRRPTRTRALHEACSRKSS